MAARVTTLGGLLRRADPEPANDIGVNHMTLDDMAEHLDACRSRVDRARQSLEQTMLDLQEAECAFVARVRPALRQHEILPLAEEREE